MLAGGVVAARPIPKPSVSATSTAAQRTTTFRRTRMIAVMAIADPRVRDSTPPNPRPGDEASTSRTLPPAVLGSQDSRRRHHRLHLPEGDVPREVLHPAVRRQDEILRRDMGQGAPDALG